MTATKDNSIHPVFPSILSTNYFNLESRLKAFRDGGINFIHLDVMDGHFVDNISFGPAAVSNITSAFDFQIDSHLMVSNPGKMVPKFIEAGSHWISFHIEAESNPGPLLRQIREHGRKAGLVLNPDCPVERVFPYLELLDYILLMSVFPGYGGQKFITDTIDRTAKLKKEICNQNANCLIQVDGGINASNIGELKKAGADLFVIGTFLFNSDDIGGTLENVTKQL